MVSTSNKRLKLHDSYSCKKNGKHGHYGGKSLGKGGETDAIVIKIKRGVVLSHKDVAQNPQGTRRRWNVHSHETRNALRLTFGCDFHHIIVWSEAIYDTIKGEVNIRHRVHVTTGDDILSVGELERTNGMVDGFGKVGRESKERSAGVDNDLATLIRLATGGDVFALDFKVVHFDLPISLARHIVPIEIALTRVSNSDNIG
jgi:hypothetical protein